MNNGVKYVFAIAGCVAGLTVLWKVIGSIPLPQAMSLAYNTPQSGFYPVQYNNGGNNNNGRNDNAAWAAAVAALGTAAINQWG